MQKKNTIRALFLLLVFSLHTITSLACSLGLDMGLNCDNHYTAGKIAEGLTPIHKDCKRQSYSNKRTAHHYDQRRAVRQAHTHKSGKKHAQGISMAGHHQQHGGKICRNCCDDDVMNVNQPDKEYAQFVLDKARFITAFASSFLVTDILVFFQTVFTVKYFARCYHPPIPDIRITIQSFQI